MKDEPHQERMDVDAITESINHMQCNDDLVRRELGAQVNELTREILQAGIQFGAEPAMYGAKMRDELNNMSQ